MFRQNKQNYLFTIGAVVFCLICILTSKLAWAEEEFSVDSEFQGNFVQWVEEADEKVEEIFEDMGWIINEYAESDKPFDESYKDLIDNFTFLVEELNQYLDRFPRLQEFLSKVEPYVIRCEKDIKDKVPQIPKAEKGKNPLAPLMEFFNKSEKMINFEETGQFKVDPLPKSIRERTVYETYREFTIAGIKHKKVIYHEVNEFENNIRILHKVIINGKVVEFEKTLDDVTILHGIPAQMREDGVNESIVRLVEEYVNLINLQLVKAHKEQGLKIPGNHKQLTVPKGYSRDDFVKNFMDIIVDLGKDKVL